MASRTRQYSDDPTVRELQEIKRLLMLQLLSDGVPASDLALALNVTKSTISETIPVRRLRSIKKAEE